MIILQASTPNQQKSEEFFQSLNFTRLNAEDREYYSDGSAIFWINKARFARPGLILFLDNLEEIVKSLKELVHLEDEDNGFLFGDMSGAWVHLRSKQHAPSLNLTEVNPSTLGKYAGVSLEVVDVDKAFQIWEALGFGLMMGGKDQGFMVLRNSDGDVVSIMKSKSCPHMFVNPSITYFNGKKNVEVIENIRKAGVSIAEEVTVFNKEGNVDNVVLTDPGGFGFFIFNDEM